MNEFYTSWITGPRYVDKLHRTENSGSFGTVRPGSLSALSALAPSIPDRRASSGTVRINCVGHRTPVAFIELSLPIADEFWHRESLVSLTKYCTYFTTQETLGARLHRLLGVKVLKAIGVLWPTQWHRRHGHRYSGI